MKKGKAKPRIANNPALETDWSGHIVPGKAVRIVTGKGRAKVKFGDVTVLGTTPAPEQVQANVARSTEALQRVVGRLMKPGIRLAAKKDVPRYSVDENHPNIFIRRLNGVTERGYVVNGVFKVIA